MAKVAEAFIGAVFGRLTVIGTSRAPNTTKSRKKFDRISDCICSCGNKHSVQTLDLGRSTNSCGCIHLERSTKHGMAGTPTYESWRGMLQRCTNPNAEHYELYKDRAPAEAWNTFLGFFADMGECPDGMWLERLDNTKPYSKDNCDWVSIKEQQNNKQTSLRVEYQGKMITLEELSSLSGKSVGLLRDRLKANWTVDDAVSLPLYYRPVTEWNTSSLVKLYPT
jgi:hypothetical protein